MNSKKNLKRNLLICLLAGSAVMYTLPLHAATSVIGNGTLPSGGQFFDGNKFTQGTVIENGHNFEGIGSITKPNDLTMNVHQNNQNAVIKWDSFNVGGSATVNFTSDAAKFNTLNYVNSGAASQIYGTINAVGGNIFVVNPAGVQIGNSAQINVGSLYVSNNEMNDDNFNHFMNLADPNNIIDYALLGKSTEAALMSLGNINANHVTFEGDGRIVIDSERLKDEAGNDKLGYKNINITTSADNTDNIIIGYDGYDATIDKDTGKAIGYAGANANGKGNEIAMVNGEEFTKADGYMWVEDVNQLQAIDTNLEGNYALRNSIDATATSSWNDEGTDTKINEGFKQIGTETNNAFTGKFDGLDYNIFGLTINRSGEDNVGLFGKTDGATINNVTLVGGSITGSNNVGAIVGNANNTTLTNVVNSAAVSGDSNVGGIVGSANNSAIKDAINTGTINGSDDNVGGLIGNLQNSKLDTTKEVEKGLIGNSYNLGDVSGKGHNVGGLVGSASNSTIGDGTNLVYNRMDVTGAYNVGGIVGNMEGSTVKYAENSGTVLASGSVTDKYNYHTDIAGVNNLPAGSSLDNGIVSIDVNVANVGGIAGSSSDSSTIKDVTNTGDVSSGKGNGKENINNQVYNYEYYTAGNVGGIVGSAVDTNITNATNRENEIRGAHNVGGVVGYFSGTGTITIDKGINDGGDIMATGARNGDGFVMESVRQSGDEDFIIGNIGGIVGYMDGKGVKVTGSANRGTVHTENIEDADNVLTISKAANVGGIVGKIDANTNETGLLSDFRNGNYKNASVSNSYNTGNVTGYTGVGGVIGMMYNGSVAGSYNQGAINTTRQVYRGGGSNIDPLNMGGIVGDTTEQTSASAVIYDVYNEGQIGDEDFEFYARHVGGIVGRLSGTVEKAYNTGDIYNNDTAVGGIVGWWYNGNIKNVFNTGNITVRSATELQVGGIAGAAEMGYKTLENAYNLGTIRGYKERVDNLNNPLDGADSDIYVGGIIGRARGGNELTIRNVYTMGNLYAGVGTYNNATGTYSYKHTGTNGLGAIYGGDQAPTLEGANYIKPDSNYFKDLSNQRGVNDISYSDRYDKDAYEFVNVGTTGNIFSEQKEESGAVKGATDDNWRIYEGSTTPILNAFLPNVKDYFDNDNNMTNISTIQYGTAYNPLLTIIKATGDLSYDWKKLGISGAASLAVYGGGLTLDNVDTSGGTGYYSGLLYTDKDLTLIATNKNNEPDATKVSGDIGLGSGAELYGSSVKIEADGTVTVYGSVTATGETEGSTGDINITAGDVDVYGTLTTGKPVSIAGIEDSAQAVNTNFENVNNPNEAMIHISERFAHEIDSANGATNNITINAGTKLVVGDDGKPILDAEGNKQYVNIGDGNVNLYFGNKEQGLITTGGNLTVTGTGDVYVDSDLDIGGNLTLKGTGADSEVVLDITNIGQVRGEEYISRLEDAVRGIELTNSNRENIINAILEAGITNDQQEAGRLAARLINSSFEDFGDEKSLEYFHEFMHHFSKVGFGDGTQAGNATITLNAGQSGNTKLTIDMWNDVTETYDLTKYDEKNTASSNNHTLLNELNNLNIVASTLDTDGGVENTDKAQKVTYIWVSSGEQLKGIQTYYDAHKKDEGGTGILSYNFALKGDINASDVEDYVAIGTGSNKDASGNEIGFTGTFDGRGNRIIGLNVSGDDAGIFSTVGTNTVNNNDGTTTTYTGTVKNLNVYSGTFTGSDNAGAVAGVNNGRIEGIVTFGNTVTATGDNGNASTSNAGGIVGVNNSGKFTDDKNDGELTNGIYDVESTGSVIAGSSSAVAGGLVGTNNGGLANSFSDSAVTVATGVTLDKDTTALGGVVGINNGNVQYVDSLGVTNGGATGSSNIGGIIGTNNGNMYSGYNESIVSGANNVGGIIGENAEGKKVENVVNATGVTGKDTSDDEVSENVGGLVGYNEGSVTNGRNNGTITGNTNVGGLVGNNADTNSTLTNLVNDSSAAITGIKNVGGIAGSNAGMITTGKADADDEKANLINRGSITGYENVGGVAGTNSGTIENANNDIELNVNTDAGNDAKYFGGIAGVNTGTITNATNQANVNADGAAYVGGIVGLNEGTLQDMAGNRGNVTGKNFVGGVAGLNNKDIDGVTASNDGVVKATEGGAGGIFAENTGNITNSTLINNKTVAGTGANGATGGIIGVNSGNISRTSLKNEVDGQVIGMNNVGGLIGVNTGTITGGRNESAEYDENGNLTAEADSYYKYQIYNNGVINVGTWTDRDGDGVVDVDTNEFNAQAGSNIGGLIGNNTTENGKTGSLTAGYNTGAINASGSTNVGGIAGSNSGKIEQVFNTIMVADGALDLNGKTQSVAVTGGTNVGGLVGNNSGILNNAYNTTSEVKGNAASTGNLVGTNSGTVQYVYGVADKLIGDGKTAENGYVIDGSDTWLQEGTYEDFTLGANGWKIYDGSTLPMLSVFLTKVTVVDQHLVDQYFSAKHYGEFHQITADDIKALIAIGAISAPDGFDAFNNNNGLIQGVADDAMANSGNWLYSWQIGSSNINGLFNPNNLGYDISLVYSPFELDDDPSSHWNYLFNDAPFDRNKDFRERKAEVNFVDGGMEI